MADDLERLFERTALDMRPQFEARLQSLLDDERRPMLWLLPDDDGPATELSPDDHHPAEASATRSFRRPAQILLLAAAASLLLFVVVGRRSAPPAPATVPAPPSCARSAETIGTVPTADTLIRVGIMPDGMSFCLADDATGEPIGAVSLIAAPDLGATSVEDPTLTFHADLPGIAEVWVITVPEQMPAEYVLSPDIDVISFPSRVGRRLLVLHQIGQGPEPSGPIVLQVFSGRDMLATLAVTGEETS